MTWFVHLSYAWKYIFKWQVQGPVTVKLQWLEHRGLVYRGWLKLITRSLPTAQEIKYLWTFKGNFLTLSWKRVVCNEHRLTEVILMSTSVMPIFYRWSKRHPYNYPHGTPDLSLWLTLSGSNYPCLEQKSMVLKMFKFLKFNCKVTDSINTHYYCSNLIWRTVTRRMGELLSSDHDQLIHETWYSSSMRRDTIHQIKLQQ